MLFNRLFYTFSTLKYQLTRKASVNSGILFQTISQTEKYSAFLPWCNSSVVTHRTQTTNETILDVKFGFYNVSYKSHVTIENPQPNTWTIRSLCKQTPFKIIDSIWRVEEIKDNLTQIQYKIEFQFQNIVYQQAASLFLNQIGEGMYQKFLTEALRRQREIRGKNSLETYFSAHPEIKQRVDSESSQLMEKIHKLNLKNQYHPNYTSQMTKGIQSLLRSR